MDLFYSSKNAVDIKYQVTEVWRYILINTWSNKIHDPFSLPTTQENQIWLRIWLTCKWILT